MRVFQTPVGQSQQGRSEHEDDKATEHEPSGLGTRPLPSSGRKPPQTQEENHCGHEKGQPITYPRTPIVAPPRLDRSNPPYHRKVMPGRKTRTRPSAGKSSSSTSCSESGDKIPFATKPATRAIIHTAFGAPASLAPLATAAFETPSRL